MNSPDGVARSVRVFLTVFSPERVDGGAFVSVMGRHEVCHAARGQAQRPRHCNSLADMYYMFGRTRRCFGLDTLLPDS